MPLTLNLHERHLLKQVRRGAYIHWRAVRRDMLLPPHLVAKLYAVQMALWAKAHPYSNAVLAVRSHD